MATPVIKLEPVRMGSLVATSSPLAGGKKYLAPNMRTNSTEPVKIDLGVKNFPSLGSAPKKISGWGKHIVNIAPVVEDVIPISTRPDTNTMKDKIKEQIRQAELEEEERQKPKQEDPEKMTREELLASGWAILSLKSESVRLAAWNLNTPFTASLTSEDYYE